MYVLSLVRHLSEIDAENSYHLFSSSWSQRYPGVSYGKNFDLHDRRIPVKVLNFLWNRMSMPPIEKLIQHPVDIAHSPTPLVMPSRSAKQITTVHDLHFYFFRNHSRAEIRRDYPLLVRKHCQKSDAIITVSEWTRKRLLETFSIPAHKVHTIYHGADSFFAEKESDEALELVRKKFQISRPFFLFVGNLEPRKNFVVLLQVFRSMPKEFALVLAGPSGELPQEYRSLLNDRVIITGYVSKQELRSLYQSSIALVLLSLEEGFSLPMVEAMASGTTVIASRIPVFEEIGGDAFYPVDHQDREAIKDAMLKVHSDQELRKELIARGKERARRYDWRKTAEQTLALYKVAV
jgi:glycosyltransferase involved in cell wall biosynthesis